MALRIAFAGQGRLDLTPVALAWTRQDPVASRWPWPRTRLDLHLHLTLAHRFAEPVADPARVWSSRDSGTDRAVVPRATGMAPRSYRPGSGVMTDRIRATGSAGLRLASGAQAHPVAGRPDTRSSAPTNARSASVGLGRAPIEAPSATGWPFALVPVVGPARPGPRVMTDRIRATGSAGLRLASGAQAHPVAGRPDTRSSAPTNARSASVGPGRAPIEAPSATGWPSPRMPLPRPPARPPADRGSHTAGADGSRTVGRAAPGAAGALVDALFERGRNRADLGGLSLRMLPTATPDAGTAPGTDRPPAGPPGVQPVPAAPLTRLEVQRVAEQVAQVLARESRRERERRGGF